MKIESRLRELAAAVTGPLPKRTLGRTGLQATILGLGGGNRDFVCGGCGQVIDRDLNASINIKNIGFNKLRAVSPEVTLVDKGALVCGNADETTLDEARISCGCTHVYSHRE